MPGIRKIVCNKKTEVEVVPAVHFSGASAGGGHMLCVYRAADSTSAFAAAAVADAAGDANAGIPLLMCTRFRHHRCPRRLRYMRHGRRHRNPNTFWCGLAWS